MGTTPEEVIEHLLLKAMEQNQTPEQFLGWVAAYKQALSLMTGHDRPNTQRIATEATASPIPLPKSEGDLLLTTGTLRYKSKRALLPPRVEDLIRLLYRHAGTPLSLKDIEVGIPDMSPSSIYPTISRAREILHSLGLASDEIIRTIGRRGTGQKAQYLWNSDVTLQAQ